MFPFAAVVVVYLARCLIFLRFLFSLRILIPAYQQQDESEVAQEANAKAEKEAKEDETASQVNNNNGSEWKHEYR